MNLNQDLEILKRRNKRKPRLKHRKVDIRKNELTIGTRLGRLTVVSLNDEVCECICDCGNRRIAKIANIIRNIKVKSCGCYFRETNRKGGSPSHKKLYSIYRNKAKGKKQEFKISQSFFDSIIEQNCHYCKSKPRSKFNVYLNLNGEIYSGRLYENIDMEYVSTQTILYNGIDRKDNTKGYTDENCLPCCAICNRAKRDMSYDDFMDYIRRVQNFGVENTFSDRLKQFANYITKEEEDGN